MTQILQPLKIFTLTSRNKVYFFCYYDIISLKKITLLESI